MKGSGYISRQCCGSTEIELGTVYAAEMGITLLSDIDRYTLEDAQVTLGFHLVLADGSVEDVPMGVFEVSEANRLAKCLELKAYDFMLRFDKSFNGFETVGIAYDFIDLISSSKVRNEMIIDDVITCVARKQTPVILTRFKEHAFCAFFHATNECMQRVEQRISTIKISI